MSDSKLNTIEERLEALELHVRGIRADIEGLREIIAGEHQHFIRLLAGEERISDAIIDRLDLIEDRLEPTFIKTFPDYGKTLNEIDTILDRPRKD